MYSIVQLYSVHVDHEYCSVLLWKITLCIALYSCTVYMWTMSIVLYFLKTSVKDYTKYSFVQLYMYTYIALYCTCMRTCTPCTGFQVLLHLPGLLDCPGVGRECKRLEAPLIKTIFCDFCDTVSPLKLWNRKPKSKQWY